MIIVISDEKMLEKEAYWINRLMEAGLAYFHVRKPFSSEAEVERYILCIKEEYRSRVVLHGHDRLLKECGLSRKHVRECEREDYCFKDGIAPYKLSTSVHTIADFNTLENHWQYAFLSPVFPSISKPGYGSELQVLNTFSARCPDRKTKLIGLGGVTVGNCREVMQAGGDGVAMLGGIWSTDNPLQAFERCKLIVGGN